MRALSRFAAVFVHADIRGIVKRFRQQLSLVVALAVATSTAHAGALTYYVLAPEHLSGDLKLMSLEPGNVITAGAVQLTLQQYDTGTITAAELYPGLVIEGTKAFVVGSVQSAADLLAPDTFAGTAFVVPHVAGSHKYYVLSPSGTANVTVQLGSNSYNLQATEGVVNEFDAGSDNAGCSPQEDREVTRPICPTGSTTARRKGPATLATGSAIASPSPTTSAPPTSARRCAKFWK